MGSEEGEIYEPIGPAPPYTPAAAEVYDSSYEWPGERSNALSPYSEPVSSAMKLRPNQSSFRLIVLHTSILPAKQKLAIIDGHSEIQFGRDIALAGSSTPRIRLKEMEVSKLHATAYWDAIRREWAIVDMGSMHGTFVSPASATGNDHGVRLSLPRQASIPRALKSMDRLTIGGTTFLVHLHEDQLPCEECWSSGSDEIPLFPVSKSSKPAVAERPAVTAAWDMGPSTVPYSPKPQKDPKKALTMLKHSLLTRHSDSSSRPSSTPPAVSSNSPAYVDRSARRRALRPASHPDAPGVSTPPLWTDSPPPPTVSPAPRAEPVISQPPIPLPASNIGHRLLMKQGWEPGTALGSTLDPSEGRVGLVEPLEVSASLHRSGLGLKRSSVGLPALSDPGWKESAKRKRWDTSGYDGK